jgi:uncharacterized protein (TIRG00374 family)
MNRIRSALNGLWIRWAGTGVSSILFLWLLLRQDWSLTAEVIKETPLWLLLVAFALYFLGMVGNALRWYVLLRGQDVDVPFTEVLKIVLSGAFASNFLPSTVGGDAVRILSISRFTSGIISVASVFVDRLLNVLVMFVGIPLSWIAFGRLGFSLASLTISGGVTGMSSITLPSSSWTGKYLNKVRIWLKKGWAALLNWRHRPGTLFLAFGISILARGSIFLAIWIVARNFGIMVSMYQVIGIAVIIYMLTLLPISINGFGVREVTMTALYVRLGANLEQASALVVVTRFILLFETLPGAIWLSDMLDLVEQDDSVSPDSLPD